jgi:hypothetical protein
MDEKELNILAKIGMSPSPFLCGWLTGVIGLILGIVLAKIIFN